MELRETEGQAEWRVAGLKNVGELEFVFGNGEAEVSTKVEPDKT